MSKKHRYSIPTLLFYLTCTALFLAQTAALLGKASWFFELFTHYTMYYALLGTVLFIAALILRHFKATPVLALLVILNVLHFGPYLWEFRSIDEEPTLTVLSQNFYFKNEKFDEFQTLLSENDPDIFVVHEAGPQWKAALETFKGDYPAVEISQETGVHGIVVGSKTPGTFQEIPLGTKFGLEFIPENGAYRLLAVHPFAPITQGYAEERNAQFADIEAYVNSSDIPTLVVGDFNVTPWSPYFQDLLEETDLYDTRLGFGIVPTWHAHNSFFQLPIDFVLASPEFQTVSFRATAKTASDHRGIVAGLKLAVQ